MPSEFTNEPLTDFSDAAMQQKMQDALDAVEKELGKEYPLMIGGEEITTNEKISSVNPANTSQVIGEVSKATKEHVDHAMKVASEAFEIWKFVPAAERADYCFKAAAELRNRKFEFSAWMVWEVGKNWVEADADTAEAIDFLEYYGREMLRYAEPPKLTAIAGEDNRLAYIPLGVGAVIPPWNFPVAILLGMTSAAFVTGNTVILKPSSDSPVVAAKVMELLVSIGLPRGVVNFIPGSGSQIGDYLVTHPKTRFISFTGSKEVGLGINELAAKTSEGQIWIKRVVAEMGGKDTIVVDAEADLDAAVDGVLAAAYGYQGQKCSACSRAVVDEAIYDSFVEKVAEKAKALTVGPVTDRANFMGPVSSEQAYNSIQKYMEIGKDEGRLLTGGGIVEDLKEGWFLQPTVFADIDPDATISLEEIFGPVLAIIKSSGFDDALKIANNTQYGLTGAIYSANREKLERARNEFHVGNLYLNRKCTGAFVGVHPFGGFNMSGTDSKAGGKDYLLLFMQAKLVSEKV